MLWPALCTVQTVRREKIVFASLYHYQDHHNVKVSYFGRVMFTVNRLMRVEKKDY